jgi:type VI secretion system secreted protein VgrG
MKRLLLLIGVLSLGDLARAQSVPPLGSARGFAVLGATTVTNTGATSIKGDLGVSPGTAVTGFPPGTVTGGTIHANDPSAVAAQADAHTAYNALAAETCGTNLSGSILGTSPGAITLPPGVYCFATSAQLTGTLTLSGNGVYVFQVGTTLTTASGSSMVLASGATAGNVFWQVGTSATFGANTAFVGNIFANISDTVTAGSSVDGRIFALTGAVTLDTNAISEPPSAVGRWEIVHTTGDNSAQTDQGPGSFSVFLTAGGTGYTFGSFTDSICVIDSENFNVVPTWVALGGNAYQITIMVDNLGLGPNFSFIYTGTFDAATPIPGDPSQLIPTISGSYTSVGDVSPCSASTGSFIATSLPIISSGSATGSLDGFTADNGSAFDSTVSATVTFTAPPADGQIAGTVSLGSSPIFHGLPCFATAGGVVNPLTINASRSSQSGSREYMFAEGFDPQGVPTTLLLNGASVNLYSTLANTDANAIQITSSEWAAFAAIGEDNPAAGVAGVSNDGSNSVMVYLYGVLGGACNGAGGVDAPFFFLSGTPIPHRHIKIHPRGRRRIPIRVRDEGREK